MYSQSDLESRIKTLDAEIAEGITTVNVDGTLTTVSMAEKRMERDRLLGMLTAQNKRRPAVGSIRFGTQ